MDNQPTATSTTLVWPNRILNTLTECFSNTTLAKTVPDRTSIFIDAEALPRTLIKR